MIATWIILIIVVIAIVVGYTMYTGALQSNYEKLANMIKGYMSPSPQSQL